MRRMRSTLAATLAGLLLVGSPGAPCAELGPAGKTGLHAGAPPGSFAAGIRVEPAWSQHATVQRRRADSEELSSGLHRAAELPAPATRLLLAFAAVALWLLRRSRPRR